MSNSTELCLFCNKAKQKIIYSGKFVFVVRDSYPVTKYHTLIIPHRHVSNFFDLSENEFIDLYKILKREMNLSQAGDALIDITVKTANGRITCAEALGHKEFVITKLYRSA